MDVIWKGRPLNGIQQKQKGGSPRSNCIRSEEAELEEIMVIIEWNLHVSRHFDV